MPAAFPAGILDRPGNRVGTQRRHGIGLGARTLEGIRPARAGNPDLSFGAGVEGLEIVVADRPVGDLLLVAEAALQAEIVGMKTVEITPHVHRAAADAGGDPAEVGDEGVGGLPGDDGMGLFAEIGDEGAGAQTRLMIVGLTGMARTLLEHQHVEPGPRKIEGERSAAGTAAEDENVFHGRRVSHRGRCV